MPEIDTGDATIEFLISRIKQHPWYTTALGAFVLYALSGFFLAPYLLEKALVDTMRRDFGAELRIDRIEINPFVLSLRVNGLELDNPEGGPTVRVAVIFANFQLSSIYRLALTFDEIRFSSPQLFIARDPSGNLDFTYLTASGGQQSGAAEAAAGEQQASLPPVLIYNFVIEDAFVNWSDQVPLEPVKTHFGPVDIAIQELNTLPDRSGRQTVTVATEHSGTLSWSGDLQLNPFRSSGHAELKDSRFPLTTAYIRHQTGLDIVDGSADAQLDYEVFTTAAGDLEARVFNFGLEFADIAINSFADGTGFDFAGEDRQILRLPAIRLADGEFKWPQKTVSLGSLTIDDPRIDLSRDENGVFNLEPRHAPGSESPAGEAEAADTESPPDEWQFSIARLAVNRLALNLVDHTVSPEARLGISDFNLGIDAISNLPGKRFPTSLSLQLASGGEISLEGEIGLLPRPEFDFDVGVTAIQLAGVQPYIQQQANLSMNSGAINLGGHVSSTEADPLLYNGDLEIVELEISETIGNERFAAWQRFHADKIALNLGKRRLDISRLGFERLYGDILINEDGTLNIEQIEKSGADPAETQVAQSAGAAQDDPDTAQNGFTVRIGDVVLKDASADFSDLSLPLPFAVKIDSLNGRMTTIATESSEPSEVGFEGKVAEYGLARVSGTVTPLDPADNTDLLVAFENIDVPSFSPYSIPFAGRKIASGRLDLKLGYTVRDSQLAGENSIVLRDFELGEKVPHPDAIDLPLGLAVALLKDADGKIDIDLPVRGNLEDPEFSYGGVILSALGNLLTKIVLSPFSALGNLLGIEASELEYVTFPDGRSDLTPPQLEKAGKMAEALALRPELQLGIAGVYDAAADGLALRSARLDEQLELRITELAASSDPSTQYADLRRVALEQLFSERADAAAATQALDELRARFTTLVEVEGEADPVPSVDNLAYANALRGLLIDQQPLGDDDLAALATARAQSLKTAIIAIDPTLQERLVIDETVALDRDDDEPIRMKVTLGSISG